EVATDVGEFTRLVEQGDPAAALRLYRGQFLSGLSVPDSSGYETWLELQRADLARTWRAAVLRECAEREARGEHAAVADLVRPVVAADGLDEEAAQVLIRSLLAAGRRSEALAAYEDLRRVLAEELQAEPLDGTAALVASVSGATGRVGPSKGPNAGQRTRGNRHPVRTTRFLGRSAEMAALEELLKEPDRRLVTVTGLGGVGKSRLALEVARRRSDEHPNGVWFVELAGTAAPELLPQAIGSATGQDLANARDAKAVLMDRLREKDTLLVLDNFEHLLDGAGLLTELLEAAPRVRLQGTSRQAMGLTGETVVELVGLATPPRGDSADLGGFDAVKLFVDRAERLSTRFVAAGSTLEAIAELTRRVEGMPLALELAATWTRSVTVDELLAELAEDIGRLAAALRDLPERQRSIRTVLDYSWRSLTPEEQRSLARLTVFRGGFTLAAAEKVTGVHAALLYGLGAHSLVSRGADGRFRVHELVRQFAAERLTGAEAQVIRAAHSRHYLSEVAERLRVSGSAERAAVIRELFDELDNVRFALEHAVESFDI